MQLRNTNIEVKTVEDNLNSMTGQNNEKLVKISGFN